ncbi:major facilitator superfamily MFS_1 [Kribbella flavida DSM 17836]|uniref:Major facilitator superfamily MFS_1 n=1 Tax=Kribbella flavida (strain DSM 17836 / JCM 10339 / NBRC 14399) TaxID=479435 RepID=D2PMA8_KRIFD|nr:MFS transporter [Kribbella flavida]ADB34476.1 major facilitator superfamily MFS_1 [Kribbella flavida DSM 17836]
MSLLPLKRQTLESTAPEAAERESARPGLKRYLTVAVLIRGANDGAMVGVVLLAVVTGAGAAAGGLLAAALIVPHLVGPWIGRILDRVRDKRRILALGFTVYAGALLIAAVLLGRAPFVLALGAALLAGSAGPLLGGGLSSRLSTRRELALDSATWGVATTAGPAAAAVLATLIGPRGALGCLGATALAAGLLVLTLPAEARRHETPVRTPRGALLKAFTKTPDLRRVALCFVLAGLGTGTFPVLVPLLSADLGRQAADGGLLLSAYGFGSLVGALLIAIRPLPGRPLDRAAICLVVMAAAAAAAALGPAYLMALLAFGVIGLANGPFLAAVMEACRQAAPEELRAQVFVTTASLKIGGAALAGALAGVAGGSGRLALAMAAGAFLLAAVADRVLVRKAG